MAVQLRGCRIEITGKVQGMNRTQVSKKLADLGIITTGVVTAETQVLLLGQQIGKPKKKERDSVLYGVRTYDANDFFDSINAGIVPKDLKLASQATQSQAPSKKRTNAAINNVFKQINKSTKGSILPVGF